MRMLINPGHLKKTINFKDDIPFSTVLDDNGNELTLYMSLLLQDGNAEMRLAAGSDDEKSAVERQPVIIWVNGCGWRGCDRNLMLPEMAFLAEHGYALAFIDYRNSSQAKFPAQLIDCKTAVRFLRAHADLYNLDTERIGIIGRSAGGHLSAFMAMNTPGYDSGEWPGFSSEVQAAVDMFGPVDICALNERSAELIKQPGYRWSRMEQTHEGALLGGDMATIQERGALASPINFINNGMAPIAILHGDMDPLVPVSISEDFYDRLVKAGMESRVELYILMHGSHGSREFFQPLTKNIISNFFDRYIRKEIK